MSWPRVLKQAPRCGHCAPSTDSRLITSSHSIATPIRSRYRGFASQSGNSISLPCLGKGATRRMSAASTALAKKKAIDRDFIVSVLEVSATKRDAKGYLQKYTGKNPKSLTDAPLFVQGDPQQETEPLDMTPPHVAIMKLRVPQEIDATTLAGVANTLSQLRKLGLLSVVVIDCGIDESRMTFQDQAFRLCEAIDSFGEHGARVVKHAFVCSEPVGQKGRPQTTDIRLDDPAFINHILHHRMMPVIPSVVSRDETRPPQPVDSNQIVLALTRYFAGVQSNTTDTSAEADAAPPKPIALVERIILLDPLGATPMTGRPGASHRFINLEQEYEPILKELMGPDGSPLAEDKDLRASITAHAANLALAKDALAMLPHTSSALITTPDAAANLMKTSFEPNEATGSDSLFGIGGIVTTRRKKNPLLHNLLTDKPVFSSSLPMARAPTNSGREPTVGASGGSTLLKKGMPLRVFPHPRENPWVPPKPGSPRLRLTDKCIDLPRLVHLIEDSFGRKLDVDDYLNRVNENLAGVIIAGEYEGGAILTWEKPEGLDDQTAYEQGRYVPYLDKFAVLRKSQGSGGCADIVFNAMVRGCLPDGVSWRSRKDNPVNKWYFERSLGTSKLSGCNWTMFWTTPNLDNQSPILRDYESVCRGVEPSWADNKHILD
ncbi:probable amino-acid N-acetyltransferase [Fusarium oxysporum]|uniref:Amino-acid acetyltransferase, mitochondrial n=2 Tax=Fusarium oxysporum TaxID=5507 RepID=N4TI54_FUSC1|nr:Amino-acid acetyltransferase, mitochondrial [Fusarium oxysporum f. sp. cubense race 1]SCO81257.1 probable amino-acid N-acetyltransferase [Fusarium oxysporum]